MADKESLQQQLFDMMRHMEEEGIVDCHFRMVYSLKEVNNPYFFAELLPTFCADSDSTIREMTQVLDQPAVNYFDLQELCVKLKGGAACLGICRMAHACGALRQAVDNQSKARCIGAVEAIRMEFSRVQQKLEIMAQLERSIVSDD